MNAVVPFAFEDSLVRAVWREGDPWFVAADACKALRLSNPSMSIKALDEDERAKFNLGRQGEATVVSEGGLYTLILRCRDATKPGTVPHRFRRWVTGEVLPALRRTGRYATAGAPAAETIETHNLRAEEHKLNLVARMQAMKGPAYAFALYRRLGLPVVEPEAADLPSPDDGPAAREAVTLAEVGDTLRTFLQGRAADLAPVTEAGDPRTWGKRGVVGFRSREGDYLLPPSTWETLMQAHGPRPAAQVLALAGWLVRDPENRLAGVARIGGKPLRVYRIRGAFLADA